MNSKQAIYTLTMRHAVGNSRYISRKAATVLYRLGNHGQGEGMAMKYKLQTADDAMRILEELSLGVTEENRDDIAFHEERAKRLYPQHSGALAAFNMALWDSLGRRRRKPVYELLGLQKPAGKTSYTISLSTNEVMEEQARAAAHLPFLIIRLGRLYEIDLDAVERIRKAAPNATLRVDASTGWSLETARRIIPKLADLGVESIEQPLEPGNTEAMKKLHDESPLPLIADEDVQYLPSLEKLRGTISGINIKLMKCGGIDESLRMIQFARSEGWRVHLGSTFETRLALSAAAHISSLADAVELDSHMMSTNDPFPPGSQPELSAELPFTDGPGLGFPLINL